MFKWVLGRQNSGYKKHTFFSSTVFRCDLHLLYVPKGCGVPKHKDPVKTGQNHHRINIILSRTSDKDRMFILGPVKRWWRIDYFRPDLYEHGLCEISNDMYILSFGWCTSQ